VSISLSGTTYPSVQMVPITGDSITEPGISGTGSVTFLPAGSSSTAGTRTIPTIRYGETTNVGTPYSAIPADTAAGTAGPLDVNNTSLYPTATTTSGGSSLITGSNSDPSTNPANSVATVNPITSSAAGDLLAQLVSSLAGGTNQGAANTGYGVGGTDTSLPPPSAADVAALQPTAATTTSSGPNVFVVLAIVAVIGLGVFLYLRHKHSGAGKVATND
jgi:hypothetical protein